MHGERNTSNNIKGPIVQSLSMNFGWDIDDSDTHTNELEENNSTDKDISTKMISDLKPNRQRLKGCGNKASMTTKTGDGSKLFILKDYSLADVSMTPRSLDKNVNPWRDFTTPRSRRYHDGPQSLGRLRLSHIQNTEHSLSEMTLNTPGRVSPRNIPKNSFTRSGNMKYLPPTSNGWPIDGTETERIEEDMEDDIGYEYPLLTDRKVRYQDSWACQTPRLKNYCVCDTIEEESQD